jgi:hypothetical protein
VKPTRARTLDGRTDAKLLILKEIHEHVHRVDLAVDRKISATTRPPIADATDSS